MCYVRPNENFPAGSVPFHQNEESGMIMEEHPSWLVYPSLGDPREWYGVWKGLRYCTVSDHSEKTYSVKGALQYFRNGTASAVVFDIFQIILVDYCHGCSCSILTNIVLWTGASELVSAVPFAPSLVPEAGHTWILTPRFARGPHSLVLTWLFASLQVRYPHSCVSPPRIRKLRWGSALAYVLGVGA